MTDHELFPDSYPLDTGGAEWIIRSSRVLTPDGVVAASVHVSGTEIVGVSDWEEVGDGSALIDAGDLLVMPGVIDTHVHCNEPGRTEWEGFETATAAAAAGGITTILDMPLNSAPATTSRYALEEKRRASDEKCHVHVGFIGGVVPGNVDELARMADGGVRAFKCFLVPSGIPEFPAMTELDMRKAFPVLAELGLPLMVHAEHPKLLYEPPEGGSSRYYDYLVTRPPESESAAIEWLTKLMGDYPVPVHIVHLSSASSLAIVRNARNRGLPITVETCPHYLTFAAEEIPDGATEYKCAPPIRWSTEREALWQALVDGEIESIASAHSPCLPEMKESGGDFFTAWPGIASLELSLPAVWTGAQARGLGVEWIARWMCESTAMLAGYESHKGRLAPGYDADITVWDPEAPFVVDPERMFQRHKSTPYAGRELLGVVHQTYVCGRLAFDLHSSDQEA
ncbi:MAG TPA: allantoinase AllB [Gemmatimonadaceae bacterium]|nr:allantoinase AllB [Gemmatimonadaceae bacterium]